MLRNKSLRTFLVKRQWVKLCMIAEPWHFCTAYSNQDFQWI